MIIWQLLSNLSHFHLSSAIKVCYFCTTAFSFEKEQIKNLFINKDNYICEVYKKICSAANEKASF